MHPRLPSISLRTTTGRLPPTHSGPGTIRAVSLRLYSMIRDTTQKSGSTTLCDNRLYTWGHNHVDETLHPQEKIPFKFEDANGTGINRPLRVRTLQEHSIQGVTLGPLLTRILTKDGDVHLVKVFEEWEHVGQPTQLAQIAPKSVGGTSIKFSEIHDLHFARSSSGRWFYWPLPTPNAPSETVQEVEGSILNFELPVPSTSLAKVCKFGDLTAAHIPGFGIIRWSHEELDKWAAAGSNTSFDKFEVVSEDPTVFDVAVGEGFVTYLSGEGTIFVASKDHAWTPQVFGYKQWPFMSKIRAYDQRLACVSAEGEAFVVSKSAEHISELRGQPLEQAFGLTPIDETASVYEQFRVYWTSGLATKILDNIQILDMALGVSEVLLLTTSGDVYEVGDDEAGPPGRELTVEATHEHTECGLPTALIPWKIRVADVEQIAAYDRKFAAIVKQPPPTGDW